jgi:hypothetical protein
VGDPLKEAEDTAALARRLADQVAPEVEQRGLRWALFLFPEDAGGHVVAISRDRRRTAIAVGRWLLEHLDAKQAKEKA